ncbi:hypothetical protein KR067_009976 [Drosophila pandora]|nr:hypothetical protein KR067_009976 [Drosophila pandora]
MTSTSRMKVLVFGLDILCTLLALVLISFGTYVVVSYDLNAAGSLSASAYLGVGVSALVIVFWGYLSAWRENVCCTVTFIALLCLVFIAQFAVVSLLFYHGEGVASNLSNPLDIAWEKELDSPGAMSLYENWFQCCGRSSPVDYIISGRLPPDTCFRNHDKTALDKVFKIGCRVEFENYWLNLLYIFNGLAGVLINVELLLGVLSCFLCNKIRNDARRNYYVS